VPTSSPLLAIEFKFKLDPDYIFTQKSPIYLMTDADLDWDIRVEKTIQNLCGNIIARFNEIELVIDTLPIFNGKIYSVLLKVIPTTNEFDSGNGNPSYLQFRVVCTEDDRLSFDSTKQSLITATHINSFISSSLIKVGNYVAANKFVGNIDKINIWSVPLNDNAFLDHAKNFDAYNNYNPSSSYQDLYFRYSVDYPIDLYTTSSYKEVKNANKYYNTSTASAYNFPQNAITTSNCINISASIFPYQFDEIDIRQNISLDNAGPNKYKNTKINKVTETVYARLMPSEKSTVSNTITQDSNLIGVYISPFKIRDDDMINFLGNYNLMNEIGNPENLYKSEYSNLSILRNQYNTMNLAEKVLYQEFLTLYKHYFDGSFFATTKQLFPIRAKVIDGILIEPSILERNKYKNQPLNAGLAADVNFNLMGNQYRITSSNVDILLNNIQLDIPKNGNESIAYTANFITDYISTDELVEVRNSIFSIKGNFTERNTTGSLESYKSYKFNKTNVLHGNSNDYSKEFTKYNFIKASNSGSSYEELDIVSYPKGHFSTFNSPFALTSLIKLEEKSISSSVFIKSQQTIYTTVNDKGIPDGSDPVEITQINKDINQISLTTS
jgi:hypothetical protein